MKEMSFSNTVKEHLCNIQIKKKCCKHAFGDGCSAASAGQTTANCITKGAAGLVCTDCTAHYIAGLFVSFGNITDPSKNYHMEFSMPDAESAQALSDILESAGFTPKLVTRKNRTIIYFKNSEIIEDLLGYMGAAFGAFEVMNAKIVKEIRGETNRQVNCDSANIAKSVGAFEKISSAINELKETGCFELMSEELQITANLRLEFPDASMMELGNKFSPPISKSGVKHRLDKITEFYENKKLEQKDLE